MRKTTIILIIIAALIIISVLGYGIYTVVDWDYDGIPTYREFNYGTDPFKKDTDYDGIFDYDEVFVYKTNPLSRDSENDGLSDLDEVTIYQSNPLSNDTDNDGIFDYDEVFVYKTNPASFDTDNDDLNDFEEIFVYNTNPVERDSDTDGLKDGDEIKIYKTNPLSNDTDNDSLSDHYEVFVYKTNPLSNDTDNDGWTDPIDLCPRGNLVLKITIIEWSEETMADKDSSGDPYIVVIVTYVYAGAVHRYNTTIQLGLNISYLANFSFIVDIPDYIPNKLASIVIRVFDNDTVDGLPRDYQYSIAAMGDTPLKQYEMIYTLFEKVEKKTFGEDASLYFRVETICIFIEE